MSSRAVRAVRCALGALLVATTMASAAGCTRVGTPTEKADPRHAFARASLRALESARLAVTDFAARPPSNGALGPDPYAVIALESGGYVGLLRGSGDLVGLDAQLDETWNVSLERSLASIESRTRARPGSIAAIGEDVLVADEQSGDAWLVRARMGSVAPQRRVSFGSAVAIRAVALGPERIAYAVEEHNDRLLWAPLDEPAEGARPVRGEAKLCGGPFRLARVARWLVAACLFDHAIVALPVADDGTPKVHEIVRAVNDGPFWGFAAAPDGDGIVIAAGGVEDHALDRTEGSFGFVDSFVYLLRASPGAQDMRRVGAWNTSELGVVTPKALALQLHGATAHVLAVGAASSAGVELSCDAGSGRVLAERVFWAPPGVVAIARGDPSSRRVVGADPLLDAWVSIDLDSKVDEESKAHFSGIVGAGGGRGGVPARSGASRLGEALFFTTIMAPWNGTEGRLSRFTCETCHFEGYVDGRTHATGRGAVRATTKPLLGLFGNRPHFSRALDKSLAVMVNNEFRVANANSGHDGWFSLSERESPWLARLGASSNSPSPIELREALMSFLIDFAPRENPHAQGRTRFNDQERAGAVAFRIHCSSCHAPRTEADRASSSVPFDEWEALVLSPGGPIVWGRDGYEKTGIEPYVHELGARVPSLRRLYKKRPYFTDGSSKTIADVLARAREGGGAFLHDGRTNPSLAPLTDADQRAIAAFIDLL